MWSGDTEHPMVAPQIPPHLIYTRCSSKQEVGLLPILLYLGGHGRAEYADVTFRDLKCEEPSLLF